LCYHPFTWFPIDFFNYLEEQNKAKLSHQVSSLFQNMLISLSSLPTTLVTSLTLLPSSNHGKRKTSLQRRYDQLHFEQVSSSAKHSPVKKLTFEDEMNQQEERKRKVGNDVSFFIQLKLQEMEARKLLIDHAVSEGE
jgi:hypothetical protein